MFEKDLKRRLISIFGVSKTTYDAPKIETPEQDCLFVQLVDVKPRMSGADGGRQVYHVTGFITLFTQNERVPFGFFYKKLEQAKPIDSTPFIFEKETNIPDSPARLQNIEERRINFTFLYDSQYDPDRGAMTSMEINLGS